MIDHLLNNNYDVEILTDVLSHNLRSPIANILGLAKVLRNEELSSSFRKNITEKLIEEAENLDFLIKNINQEIEKQYA